jgi:hypothetical protein
VFEAKALSRVVFVEMFNLKCASAAREIASDKNNSQQRVAGSVLSATASFITHDSAKIFTH